MNELQQLLAALPDTFDKDPQAVPVLRCVPRRTPAVAVVQDDTLTVTVADAAPLRYALVGRTLGQLAADLTASGLVDAAVLPDQFWRFAEPAPQATATDDRWRLYPLLYLAVALAGGRSGWHDGYQTGWYLAVPGVYRPVAAVAAARGMADLGAQLLLDGVRDLGQDPRLLAPTSVLYHALKPLAYLLRACEAWRQALVAQLDLRAATGGWLDLWGRLYGLPRFAAEPDELYRGRLQAVAVRPRANPVTLARALREAYDLPWSEVRDEEPFQYALYFTLDARHTALMPRGFQQLLDQLRPAGTRVKALVPALYSRPELVRPAAERYTLTLAYSNPPYGPAQYTWDAAGGWRAVWTR